eukprot:scaffold264445_cov28-Tisochrysis_lutea.AAC.4
MHSFAHRIADGFNYDYTWYLGFTHGGHELPAPSSLPSHCGEGTARAHDMPYGMQAQHTSLTNPP